MKETTTKLINRINSFFTKRSILIMTIILAIIILIPIIWVSFYTHPSADDFNYGVNTINKIETGGLLTVFQGMIKQVKYSYTAWQGTYSAVALFALNPSVFGDDMYFLTTFIIIITLFIGLYVFFKQSIYECLKSDKITLYLFSLIFFLLSIETIPSKIEGLFWWNGSSYYMIFFSLELIEFSLLIKRYVLNKKTNLNYIGLCLLIFFIGGGNFITALQQIIILFFLNAYLIFVKKDKNALPLFILSIVSLGISAIAPGNAVREAASNGMNPIKAIILSFVYAFNKMFEWMNPLNFIVICILVVLLYPTYKNIKFRFKYPVLFILFMYCIFSAEFTPTLYSQSGLGGGRLWNIMYISYLLFLVMSFYYLIGFIRNKLIENKVFNKNAGEITLKIIKQYSAIIFISVFGILLTNLFLYKYNLSSYQSYKIIKNGEAEQYDKEWKERMKVLKDKSIKNVEFEELSVYPSPIVYSEFSENKESWLNLPAAQIYDKNYIKLIKR